MEMYGLLRLWYMRTVNNTLQQAGRTKRGLVGNLCETIFGSYKVSYTHTHKQNLVLSIMGIRGSQVELLEEEESVCACKRNYEQDIWLFIGGPGTSISSL